MGKTYQLKNLSEKSKYNYVFFDHDNDMLLTVPVAGGTSISMDNTCKASLMQDAFADRKLSSKQYKDSHSSAMSVLRKLRDDLEFDLGLLNSDKTKNSTAIAHKTNRLRQVNSYIRDVDAYLRSRNFNSYYEDSTGKAHNYRHLTATARALIEKATNAHAVLLSPQGPDWNTRFITSGHRYATNFSRNRNNITGTTDAERTYGLREFGFMQRRQFSRLHQNLQALKTTKDTVIEDAIQTLGKGFVVNNDTSYQLVIDTLKASLSKQLGIKQAELPDLEHLNGEPYKAKVNFDYLKLVCGIDNFSDFAETGKTPLEGLMNSIFTSTLPDNFWEFYQPVDVFRDPIVLGGVDELDAAVQFFFATANIYARTHKMTHQDFGHIIESGGAMPESEADYRVYIPRIVVAALRDNQSVGEALLSFINENYQGFGMYQQFNTADRQAILTRFNQNFNIIKTSEKDGAHFDEFLTFVDDVPGDFVINDSAISYPFSQIMTSSEGRYIASQTGYYQRLNAKVASQAFFDRYQNKLRSDVPLPNLNIEISSEAILTKLQAVSNKTASAEQFATLLLAETQQDGQYLFDELEPELVIEIMSSPAWKQIAEHFEALCNRSAGTTGLKNRFNAIFDSSKQKIKSELDLNFVSRFLTKSNESATAVQAALAKHDIAVELDAIQINSETGSLELNVDIETRKKLNALESSLCHPIKITQSAANVLLHLVAAHTKTDSDKNYFTDPVQVTAQELADALTRLRFGRFSASSSDDSCKRYNRISLDEDGCLTLYTAKRTGSALARQLSPFRHPLDDKLIDNIVTYYNLTQPSASKVNKLTASPKDVFGMLQKMNVTQLFQSNTEELENVYALPEHINAVLETVATLTDPVDKSSSAKATKPKKKPSFSAKIKSFFNKIYYFFYELFHWCRRLSFNKITRTIQSIEDSSKPPRNAKEQTQRLVASLCAPEKTASALEIERNTPYISNQTANGDLIIDFSQNHDSQYAYSKSKNLGYTLMREGIEGVHVRHRRGHDYVLIQGKTNQHQFFQKLLNCEAHEARRVMNNLEIAAPVMPSQA